MGEVYNLLAGDQLEYNGYFDIQEVYYFIDSFFKDRGYDKWIEKEVDTDNGKERILDTTIKMVKKFSNYAQGVMIIRIVATIEKEEDILIGKEKKKMQYGNLRVIFEIIYLETDYEGKWNKVPLLYVYRWFMDRFIAKKYNDAYISTILNDHKELKKELKVFLGIRRLA